MGEHSDSENVRVEDPVDERVEDVKEPIVEPREVTVEKEPQARPRSGAGKWLGAAALLVALAALAIAVINVVRPDWTEKFDKTPVTTAAAPAGPTEQQVADAKIQTCDAFNTVATAVSVRSNAPLGPDPAAAQAEAVSANARLAFSVGHDYVLEQLNPATPQAIADGVRKFANLLQVVSINSLAGIDQNDPVQTARLQDVVNTGNELTELCK